MRQTLTFVLIGLLYVSIPEFTNLILVNGLPEIIPLTILLYTGLLLVGSFMSKQFDKLQNTIIANILYALLFGGVGIIIEYVYVGHAGNELLWGMFVYWVGLFMIPRILSDTTAATVPVRKRTLQALLWYLSIHFIISLGLYVFGNSIQQGGGAWLLATVIPWVWTVAYTAAVILYWQYMRSSSAGR